MAGNGFDDMKVPEMTPISLTFGEDGTAEVQEEASRSSVPVQGTDAAPEAAAQMAQAAPGAAGAVQAAPAAEPAQADPASVLQAGAAKVTGTSEMVAHASAAIQDAEVHLTPEEERMVEEFAKKIDISNSQAIMQYGAGTQKKMSEFSDTALAGVRNKDMGEVGEEITALVTQLKSFDVDKEPSGFMRFFKKEANKATALKARYDKTEESVDEIVAVLEKHQVQLLKDVATLDRMYQMNLAYYKELSMYILAGRKKLEEVRNGELKELQLKAEQSGDTTIAQQAKDLAAQCDRFEKKLYDLELTRQIALQTGPQIRLVQDSDTMMAEKIQSTIVNTIPLWKNQMVIALGIEHSNQAARAQQEVTDVTNALLKKNAEQLHQATVETAKASERGVVDMETLKATNAQLISTLDDVVKIQEEGRQKRQSAEAEMEKMEADLKSKLLAMSRT